MTERLVVVGGGFAGLWSAAAAARLRAERDAEAALEIVLVAPSPFHVIRVRCYETDLSGLRVPLDDVLAPIGVRRIAGSVGRIDPVNRRLAVARADGGAEDLAYDRLVLAAGSALVRPPVPGAADGFDVDTDPGAARLAAHLAALAAEGPRPGRWSAVVVGAGLVGIEIACELPGRLRALRAAAGAGEAEPVRVVLLERGPEVGATMGAARAAIAGALAEAGVETRTGAGVRAVDPDGMVLEDGERIDAATTVWATGMRASPLAADLPVPHDPLGRVPVDAFLRVEGLDAVYAAGDVARAAADAAGHATVMSCQHARPMGRLAGHNAACDLLGCPEARLAFAAPDYVTVLDLGPWGAAYTAGWDRGTLRAAGADAKATKRTINRARIYPPLDRDRAAILAAAVPIIQAAPALGPAAQAGRPAGSGPT
ncbi:NADH dehydrogenase-like protein [Methylobacterium crusticola]|uniref:NADH dehydrogenase-like protein n=1 Tax=Methylobacterium crusticola TaxID=1697972 RepID=A0ABQ4QX72_9HYPH|nr:FAD-dependent oxidoreductase [Methylobacterium crusticola]GJD49661.1 NADH dehydrogenase-like protein [Methylobacterium crusticola]